MTPDLQRQLVAAIAKRTLKSDFVTATASWAQAALEAGVDSPSLRVLAGLDKLSDEDDANRYLERTASELGIKLPSEAEAIRLHAKTIAQEIVSGSIPPLDGCKKLYELHVELHSPDFLSAWTGLDDAVSLASNGTWSTIEQVEEEIVAEAERMLRS